MKEQEVIKRLNFHKEYVRLYSSRVVMISETDLETVLNMLKEKDELYHKALEDLVKADRENIKKDKIIDLMAEYINHLSDELVQTTGRNELEFCDENKCCKDSEYSCEQCIKQYFERKSKE